MSSIITPTAPDEPPNGILFNAIMDWGSQEYHPHQIREGYESQGGWEGWLQVNLAELFGGSPACEREEHCYANKPSKAADLCLRPPSPFAQPYVEDEVVIMELKCESRWNGDAFKKGVREDLEKIRDNDINRDLKTKQGGCNVYMLAFAMGPEGENEMESLGMRRFDNGDEPPFTLWWYMIHRPKV